MPYDCTIWPFFAQPSKQYCQAVSISTGSNSKFKQHSNDMWVAECEFHTIACTASTTDCIADVAVCAWVWIRLHNPQSDCYSRFPPGWVTTLQCSSFSPFLWKREKTTLMWTEPSSCASPRVFTGCCGRGDYLPLSALGFVRRSCCTHLLFWSCSLDPIHHHTNQTSPMLWISRMPDAVSDIGGWFGQWCELPLPRILEEKKQKNKTHTTEPRKVYFFCRISQCVRCDIC